MMFREPENGMLTLVGANEYQRDVEATYTVTDLTTDRMVLSGTCALPANAAVEIGSVPYHEDGMHFYLMEWQAEGKTWRNHYVSGNAPYNFDAYYN